MGDALVGMVLNCSRFNFPAAAPAIAKRRGSA
jgi:hypothetical protein